MRLEKALPPAQKEAARQLAFAREFELALKQRRRIFFAQMKKATYVARKSKRS